jgi:hypothetical protein
MIPTARPSGGVPPTDRSDDDGRDRRPDRRPHAWARRSIVLLVEDDDGAAGA